jgi:hypothetical protein
MTYNIFKKDVEEDIEMDIEMDETDAFCDPEKPKDWCHFENISYKGTGMAAMNFAHNYFLVINWIQFFFPFGMWALWVVVKVDIPGTIMPFVDDVTALIDSISAVIAAVTSADPNGDGVEGDAADITFTNDAVDVFGTNLEAINESLIDITAIFTWPMLGALVIGSLNSISNYWPMVLFPKTRKGGAQPRTSAWWSHIKTYYW